MLIAQVSDIHISDSPHALIGVVDNSAVFATTVAELNAMKPRPDIVLLTGDLVNDGTVADYQVFRALLKKLEIPFRMIPGNHDNHTEMVQVLGDLDNMGEEGAYIQHDVDEYPVRLIGLDTTMEGHHSGELCDQRIAWLSDRLDENTGKPTAIFMHHPPFDTGIWWMDGIGITRGVKAFEQLLEQHQQVKAVYCGHVHRLIQSTLGGVPVFVARGLDMAVAFDLGHEAPPKMLSEPPAILFHKWTGNTFVTHTHFIGQDIEIVDMLPNLTPNWPHRVELIRKHAPIPKKLGF